MRNQLLGGRLRGDILPATTWANRPAANTVSAQSILPITGFDVSVFAVPDVATNQWKPFGGSQVLYRRAGTVAANGIAREQGTGGTRSIVLPSGLGLIPAGMLFVGSRIEARVRMQKEGTETGNVTLTLDTSATSNSLTRQFQQSGSANAANPSVLHVVGATDIVAADTMLRMQGSGPTPWIAGSSSNIYSDLTGVNLTSTDMYVNLVLSTTFTSAAFVTVLSFSVTWMG